MKTINEIIDELMMIKESLNESAEDILYSNIDYEYKDLTEIEIQKLNKCRKNIYYIYDAITTLDIIKEK